MHILIYMYIYTCVCVYICIYEYTIHKCVVWRYIYAYIYKMQHNVALKFIVTL